MIEIVRSSFLLYRCHQSKTKLQKKFKLWQIVNLLPREPGKFYTVIFKYQNCCLSSQFLSSTVILLLYLMWFNFTFFSFSSLSLCLCSGPTQRFVPAPQIFMLGLLLGPCIWPVSFTCCCYKVVVVLVSRNADCPQQSLRFSLSLYLIRSMADEEALWQAFHSVSSMCPS